MAVSECPGRPGELAPVPDVRHDLRMKRRSARIALSLGLVAAVAAAVVVYRSVNGTAGLTGPIQLTRTLSVGREMT